MLRQISRSHMNGSNVHILVRTGIKNPGIYVVIEQDIFYHGRVITYSVCLFSCLVSDPKHFCSVSTKTAKLKKL